MPHDHLHRDDAPFGPEVWQRIDETAVEAARSRLSARRILHVEGPYGLGLKALAGADEVIQEEADATASVAVGALVPLAALRKTFTLAARDIAAFEQTGVPFSTAAVAGAAVACAASEDALVLRGSKALRLDGLLTAKGTQELALRPWDEVGAAADDLIRAATLLDDAGFHGPYALALAPALFNLLFRRYEQGNTVEIEHVRTLVTEGVVKAPGLDSGGVLIASGRQFATIVLGQDLMAGFVGPTGGDYELTISETVALRLQEPGCVCVLKSP